MVKQKITPLKKQTRQTHLSRLWFIGRGYKQADPRYTDGQIVWLHPETNDVLTKYGTKLTLTTNGIREEYLKLPRYYGNMYLARLKYLTFKGEIPEGYTIDHIDGNTMNNNIDNLRAIPDAINSRDGGFMRKLRHNGFIVASHPTVVILKGYENMARWKDEHSGYAYRHLRGKELERVFFGPKFTIVDPDIIMDLDFKFHREY